LPIYFLASSAVIFTTFDCLVTILLSGDVKRDSNTAAKLIPAYIQSFYFKINQLLQFNPKGLSNMLKAGQSQ
jgi:hypothetical protein